MTVVSRIIGDGDDAVRQVPLPAEYTGRRYQEFYNHVLDHDALVPLALYRSWAPAWIAIGETAILLTLSLRHC